MIYFKWFTSKWVLAVVALGLVACGDGSTANDVGTSDINFQVAWQRSAGYQPTSLTACDDVTTVRATVVNTSGDLLGEGGPWGCAAGNGAITGLPANYYATVAVAGYGPDDALLYYGQNQIPIFLTPGSVDGGVITATAFIPVLVSPIDTANVTADGLELQWRRLPGADGYRVTLATDSSFETIIEQISIDSGDTVVAHPDPSALLTDYIYYWRVEAVSETNHFGLPSTTRQFTVGTTLGGLTTPELSIPADGALLAFGELELGWNEAHGATGYRVALASNQSFDAESIVWQSDIAGGSTTNARPAMQVDLLDNATFYWRVAAIYPAGLSDPSPMRRFDIRVLSNLIFDYDFTSEETQQTVVFNSSSMQVSENYSDDFWYAELTSSEYLALQNAVLNSRLLDQGSVEVDNPEICYWGTSDSFSISMTLLNDRGNEFNINSPDSEYCRSYWPDEVRNLVVLIDNIVDAHRTPLP